MKGLIRGTLIVAAIVTVGIVASIIMASDLNNKVAGAREHGVEQGRVQGYQVGFQKGSADGYQEGSKAGYAQNLESVTHGSDEGGFYFCYNPSYDDVERFFAEEEKSSAWEIHDYAEANGMRAAYVRVQIARKAAEGKVWVYRLVAFDTVDNGFVIIEPWSHKVVEVEVGERFHELNGFPPSDYDDTITKVTIVW